MKHFTGKKFFNPWPNAQPHGMSGMIRWTLERFGKTRKTGTPPVPVTEHEDLRSAPQHPRVTWVGHSTFLIQIGELNFLTDPIWSNRASPVQLAGPRRISNPGIALTDLPPIHAVLISHDHYDHLDHNTVRILRRDHPAAQWFAPWRVGRWLAKHGVRNIVELDWDESTDWKGVRITCIPAQHFSGRSISGRDETLWCGWMMGLSEGSIMFAGDTGLHPEFSRIAAMYGPVTMAILPIGAYDPRWFMRTVHMDPDDAVAAYLSISTVNPDHRCVFIPSHWGTFLLTDEPADEPQVRLRKAWRNAGLHDENCAILRPGESFSYRP